MRFSILVLAVCLLAVPAARGQWLEATIGLPDSVLPPCRPTCLVRCTFDNTIYVAGENPEVLVVDARDGRKVAHIAVSNEQLGRVRAMCYNPTANKVYCTVVNGSPESTLVVIDAAQRRVVKVLCPSDWPAWLACDPRDNKVYCASAFTDSLWVIDCTADSFRALVRLSRCGGPLCYDQHDNTVYACDPGTAKLLVIDGTSDSVVGSVSFGAGVSLLCPDAVRNKMYCGVRLDTANWVVVVDCNLRREVARVRVGWWPTAICHNPVHGKVYCSAARDENVAIIDAVADTLISLVRVGHNPVDLAWNPASGNVYCANQGWVPPFPTDSTITVIDGLSNQVVATMVVGDEPVALGPDSLDNYVFCAAYMGYCVATVSGATNEVERFTEAGDRPQAICYIGTQQKVYCATWRPYRPLSRLVAIDGTNNTIVAAPGITGAYHRAIAFSPATGKLYCTEWDRMAVVDVASDSVLRRIAGFEDLVSLCYNPARDRLYCSDGEGNRVVVVDCAGDSIVGAVDVGDTAGLVFCNPVADKVYCATEGCLAVIDCVNDSVVARISTDHEVASMALNEARNKVYCGSRELLVVDGVGDSVIKTIRAPNDVSSIWYNRASDRVCVAVYLLEGSVLVLDGNADSVVAQIPAGRCPIALAGDAIRGRLYCINYGVDGYTSATGSVTAIDLQGDTVLTTIELGRGPLAAAWNPEFDRLYVCNDLGGTVSVVRDGPPAVSERWESSGPGARQGTVWHRSLTLGSSTKATLLDAAGRRVMELLPGPNDARHLAPGVYFVREKPQASSFEPKAVTKVVITR